MLIRSLLDRILSILIPSPFFRMLEVTLLPGETYTFSIDAPFEHWTIYNTCNTGGFIRIGANLQSVPVVGSLYLGQNGKVTFPATSRVTTVTNPSAVTVTIFAVGFSRAFDIQQTMGGNDESTLLVGETKIWNSSTIPAGWLEEDGAEISRTTYSALFAVIGTTFGSGNGTTTFNLPNSQGKVFVARDITDADFNVVGEFRGTKSEILEVSQIPAHGHTQDAHNHTQDAHNHTQNSHNHTQNSHSHSVFGLARNNGTGSAITTLHSVSSQDGLTNSVTATNIAATATNIAATATNIAATATNQAATATNQNTGGGLAHNNIQPSIVKVMIIYTGVE